MNFSESLNLFNISAEESELKELYKYDKDISSLPLISLLIAVYFYRAPRNQYSSFLAYHLLMYCSIIAGIIFELDVHDVKSQSSNSLIRIIGFLIFDFFHVAHDTLVMGLGTLQLFFLLCGVKNLDQKRLLIVAAPVLVLGNFILKFAWLEIEINEHIVRIRLLDILFIILNTIFLIVIAIGVMLFKRSMSRENFYIVIHCAVVVMEATILQVFSIPIQLLLYESRILRNALFIIFNSYHLPFIWIISVCICYSNPVQKWISNRKTNKETSSEFQMAEVTVSSRARRGTQESRVSDYHATRENSVVSLDL